MKRQFLTLAFLALLAIPATAQRVSVDNFDRLQVHFTTPEVQVAANGYLQLAIDGYMAGGQLGAPTIPVQNHLLAVPMCDSIVVTVSDAVYDTVDLPAGQVQPLQPSVIKSGQVLPFQYDEALYGTDVYFGMPLASVSSLGIGRDRPYAMLTYAPVRVNPVSGKMVVCRRADITVRYVNSDPSASLKFYTLHHTPAFSLGATLNNLYAGSKAATSSPLRMVVLVPQSLQCAAIDEFIDWKRQQGLLVDTISFGSSSTSSALARRLQTLYTDATEQSPAPTYVVLVGDNNRMPTFSGHVSSWSYLRQSVENHVTDHPYNSWTSDDLPDAYMGRLSARDTSSLRNIIDKTLYYEKYQFADDGYLERAVLIAGYDNGYGSDSYDNAWRCADPTMDYLASNYFSGDSRFDSLLYYKNNYTYSPAGVTVKGSSTTNAAANALRNAYNNGVGWVNYSAHGDWNCWYRPSFTTTHVSQMSNTGRPGFMIGNCCLSNKFDETTCLGESLLRRGERAGAIGYIGATNSTFWDEDFYWSVGLRNNISNTMYLNYDASRRGMYDNLFHTHGEPLSDHVATAGAILVAGNMSVNRCYGSNTWTNQIVPYYWEIYELMGDPSLMPWLGRADVLELGQLTLDGSELSFSTVPGAYVALVDSVTHALIDATHVGTDGAVRLSAPADRSTTLVSITAQGYRPYIRPLTSHNLGIANAAADGLTVSPNPASMWAEVSGTGLQQVTVLDAMGRRLATVAATADRCRLDLSALPAGIYLLRIATAEGTALKKLVVK